MKRELAEQILNDIRTMTYPDFCNKYGEKNTAVLGTQTRAQYFQMKVLMKSLNLMSKEKYEHVITIMMKDKKWKE